MPVIIRRPSPPPPTTPRHQTQTPHNPNPQRRRLDDIVKALAPIIVEIRKAGHHGITEIAMCLNDKGLLAPSGGPFTYETTRRILKHIKLLGLGGGPRTKSAAMVARAEQESARRWRKFAEDVARRSASIPNGTRESIDPGSKSA